MNKNFNGVGFPDDDRKETDIPLGGRILRVVWDFERLNSSRADPRGVLHEMAGRNTWYDPEVVRALGRFLQSSGSGDAPPVARQLSLHELRTGQVLLQGIETVEGLLVIPEGTRLNLAYLQKLRNFARLSGIREPILVTEG
jgi:hypothetical protein